MTNRPADLGLPLARWESSPRMVLLFGGTFDPPHRGHIELPAQIAKTLDADWLVYVPAAQSPHKRSAPGASGAHRLGMLRAALRDQPRCSVSDLEVRRSSDEPSFTVDTLREVRESVPESVTLRLLIGADQALALHRWRDPGEILALAEPIVMHRASAGDASALAEQLALLPAPVGGSAATWHARVVDVPSIDVSATRVRALLRHGSDLSARAELRRLVPGPVLRYIHARGLYRDVPGA